MIKATKFLMSLLIAVFLISGGAVFAQETEVSAQDLEVSDPTLLPDSPFYFLKEWSRSIRLAFTFNNVAKVELQNRFTNEKMIELQKMVKNSANAKSIEKATENYKRATERIRAMVEDVQDDSENNETINKFLDKFTNQQVLHEKILQKLQDQVPEDVFEKISEAREAHLEKFQEIMQKLEKNQEKITERIQNALQNGQEDIEILDEIREKMPNEMKGALNRVRQKIQERTRSANGAPKACTLEYAPVCGTDGKTYSNKCHADASGVSVSFEGECENMPGDDAQGCETLWWLDASSTACQKKQFCGTYMYQGLQTFENENSCEEALESRGNQGAGDDAGTGSGNGDDNKGNQ